jgi:hypothetical protein
LFSVATITAKEGTVEQYNIQLIKPPTGAVTITLTSTSPSDVTVSPSSITITDSTKHVILVTLVDDLIEEPDIETWGIVHTFSSPGVGDERYNNRQITVDVKVLDNDVAAVRFVLGDSTQSSLLVPSAAMLTSEGAKTVFNLRLLSKPMHPVTLQLQQRRKFKVGASYPHVQFEDPATPNVPSSGTIVIPVDQWDTSFKIVFHPMDDDVAHLPSTFSVDVACTSVDPFYNGPTVDTPVAEVEVNDQAKHPGILVDRSLQLKEGEAGNCSVSLASRPTESVVLQVFVESTDPRNTATTSDIRVSVTTITIPVEQWNHRHNVTVTALSDTQEDEEFETVHVVFRAVSTDRRYGGGAGAGVDTDVNAKEVALVVQIFNSIENVRTVTTEQTLDGYTTDTFQEAEQEAFKRITALLLGVDPGDIVITSVKSAGGGGDDGAVPGNGDAGGGSALSESTAGGSSTQNGGDNNGGTSGGSGRRRLNGGGIKVLFEVKTRGQVSAEVVESAITDNSYTTQWMSEMKSEPLLAETVKSVESIAPPVMDVRRTLPAVANLVPDVNVEYTAFNGTIARVSKVSATLKWQNMDQATHYIVQGQELAVVVGSANNAGSARTGASVPLTSSRGNTVAYQQLQSWEERVTGNTYINETLRQGSLYRFRVASESTVDGTTLKGKYTPWHDLSTVPPNAATNVKCIRGGAGSDRIMTVVFDYMEPGDPSNPIPKATRYEVQLRNSTGFVSAAKESRAATDQGVTTSNHLSGLVTYSFSDVFPTGFGPNGATRFDTYFQARVRVESKAGFGIWGNWSTPGFATCAQGTQFLQTQLPESEWNCSKCPVGMDCDRSVVASFHSSLLSSSPTESSLPGVFSLSSARDLLPSGNKNFANHTSVRCLKGYWEVPWQNLTCALCPVALACDGSGDGADGCAGNQTGVLCLQCPDGWKRQGDGCQKCLDPFVWNHLAVAAMLVVVLGGLVYLVKFKKSKHKSKRIIVVRQLMNFMQMLGAMGQLKIKGTASYSDTVAAVQSVFGSALGFYPINCSLGFNYVMRFAVIMGIPFGLVGMVRGNVERE